MKNIYIKLALLILTTIYNVDAQWTFAGLSGKSIYSIISIGDFIIVGTQNEGVYRARVSEGIWSQVGDNDLKLASIEAIDISENMLIACTNIVGRATYTSIDSGATWTPVNSIIDGYPVSVIAHGDTVLVGTLSHGAYISFDKGNTWASICSALYSPKNVRSMLWKGNTIYVGTHTNYLGVWKTTDWGSSWDTVNTGLPRYDAHFIMDIRSLFSDGHNIYAGTLGDGCYKTTNDGIQWEPVNSGLPSTAYVDCFTSYESTIYLSTYGVYQSTNGGMNWISISDNLPSGHPIMALHIHNNILYAGVYGNGLWKLPLAATKVKGNTDFYSSKIFLLNHNYPNPFNSSTTFSFHIPRKLFVTLTIFDQLGREVANLISGELSSGYHSYHWNASHISSGVYYYRLQAGLYTETKKLILLR